MLAENIWNAMAIAGFKHPFLNVNLYEEKVTFFQLKA